MTELFQTPLEPRGKRDLQLHAVALGERVAEA
jgi:hypothetical protein